MAEPTVADLAERYLRMHVAVQCKASSKSRYERLLRNQILPALGEGQAVAAGGGGNPLVDADRVPEQRDLDAALG